MVGERAWIILLQISAWDLRPPTLAGRVCRPVEQGQNQTTDRGPAGETGFCQGPAAALGLVRNSAWKSTCLDRGKEGEQEGRDPGGPTDEPHPQGAREHGHDRWKQGRWNPGRNRWKVLLDGGQLQVRALRG